MPDIPLQTWDNQSVPSVNKEGVTYPTWFIGSLGEGGSFTSAVDATDGIGGGKCLRITLDNPNTELYADFKPYDGFSVEYARIYAACGWPAACGSAANWLTNTYTHLEYWVKVPTNSQLPNGQFGIYTGQGNLGIGTYTRAYIFGPGPVNPSQECGNCHWYHYYSVEPTGTWWRTLHNWHPDHQRSINGVDAPNCRYITSQIPTDPGGVLDPPNTYNYFDCLSRFYLQSSSPAGGPWKIDQMRFVTHPPEDDVHLLGSMTGTYVPATTRFIVNWVRPTNDENFQWDVRYAFSDIHSLGWNNATVAPNSPVIPLGGGSYAQVHWEATTIPTAGHSSVFFAVRSQNTTGNPGGLFSQIEIPLDPTAPPVPDLLPPTVPTLLAATNIKPTRLTLTWNASTDAEVAQSEISYQWRRNGVLMLPPTAPGVTTVTDTGLTASTPYTYDVRAIDPSNNPSAFSSTITPTTLAPDTTPPSTPTWGTATPVSSTQITLSWNASTDNVDSAAELIYRVFRNGVQVGTTLPGVTTFTDAGLTANTPYNYTLRAVDMTLLPSTLSAVLPATTLTGPAPILAWAFNEGTGTTVADASGNGRTGTLENGATWTTNGHTSQAVSLVGGTSRVRQAALAAPADKTFSFWVFIRASAANYNTILEFADDAPWLGLRSTGVFEVYPTITTPTPLSLNTWHHIAYTSEAAINTGRLYVNATLVATGTANTQTGTGFCVGVSVADSSLDGLIDDLRIYNAALSQAQIQTDMFTPVGGAILDTTAPAAPANLRVVSP